MVDGGGQARRLFDCLAMGNGSMGRQSWGRVAGRGREKSERAWLRIGRGEEEKVEIVEQSLVMEMDFLAALH